MLEPSFLFAPVPVYAPGVPFGFPFFAGQRLHSTADEAPLTTLSTARFRCAHRPFAGVCVI
ncbi:hypothetical protein HMPREF3162_03650 [Brevibacterium sp. HMSC07C04]|nr:hypothetical protein HMPREF3162_03650 [Brevibacterium sp. HMSC07C04]